MRSTTTSRSSTSPTKASLVFRWGLVLMAATLLYFPISGYALRYYQINLVVFKLKDSNYLSPEKPFDKWHSPISSNDIEIKDVNITNSGQQLSGSKTLLDTSIQSETLSSLTQQLASSTRYEILYAKAWTTAFKQGETKKFQLQSSATYNQLGQSISNNEKAINSPFDVKNHQVMGELTATLNYYLDINVKIQYLRQNFTLKQNILIPEEMTELNFTPLDIFEIDQDIRTASNKLWYLDGEVIGALLEFIPVEENQIHLETRSETSPT